jgi:hypothetical protein
MTVRPPARTASSGLLVAALLLLGIGLPAALRLTEPERWDRGVFLRGRDSCTRYCRVRGGIADVLRPREPLHCLCGGAWMSW